LHVNLSGGVSKVKNKSFVLILVVLLLSGLLLGGCGGSSEGESITRLSFGTGGTSGVYYPIGGGMASLINKYVENVDCTAEVTGASIENNRLVDLNEMQLGMSNADIDYYAYKGMDPFDKPTQIRIIGSLFQTGMQAVVTKDITSWEDLRGKRVSVGPPGGSNRRMTLLILEKYGITEEDFKPYDLSFTESVEAMGDHNLDAACILSGLPAAAVMDITTNLDVKLLPIDEEVLDSLLEEYSYFSKFVIPANYYNNEDAVLSLGITNELFTNEEQDEEIIYEVTKAIFEHLDELCEIHQLAEQITSEDAVNSSVPFHPGAIKYWKEVGLME